MGFVLGEVDAVARFQVLGEVDADVPGIRPIQFSGRKDGRGVRCLPLRPVHINTGRCDLIDQGLRDAAEAVVRIPLAMKACVMDVHDPFTGRIDALGDFPVLRVNAA